MPNAKYLSTTALSKKMNIPVADLFKKLLQMGLIKKEGDSWSLTDEGKEKGGTVKYNKKIGYWIAWPENIGYHLQENEQKLLNATKLSEHFNIGLLRMNPILSELGWIKRDRKGWVLTKLGRSMGGIQFEHKKTGVPFVCWPENIVENKLLSEDIKEIQGEESKEPEEQPLQFRVKYEANLRSADGHYVRSRAEMLIDNWLYMSEIVHAYERKLPIEEDVYCDFYLPVGKVYIEYWGYEENDKYLDRKQVKQEIYKKYEFNLIELNDKDIQNLDDILPRKLLKFGIQSY